MGDGSDSESDHTTVLNLKSQAGRILRDQRLRQQQEKMEWKNEMDPDNHESSHPQQTRGFRQPLLPRSAFSTLREEDAAEDNGSFRPIPPPRLTRKTSETERPRDRS